MNYTIDGVAYVASDPVIATPTPTATTPPTPTPTATPNPTDHVGDLDGSATPASGGKWNATIVIPVEDANHNPVANATVSGVWSAGASGSGSCVTNGSGQCTVTKNNINKNSSSVTFRVDNVTHATYTYTAVANHDPDADSSGTAITVNKP